jgi:sporulation protein YlmC with PRC-barrel domain
MDIRNIVRTVGFAAAAASLPALIAIAAHAQSPAPAPQTPPGAVKVVPPAADVDSDMSKSATPAPAPSKGTESAAGNAGSSTAKDITVGSSVVGSDGEALGEVKGVKADPAGKIEEIHVKTGSILGFGGKIVVIPGAKISKGGQTVQVAMTAAEVGKLPALAEKKG